MENAREQLELVTIQRQIEVERRQTEVEKRARVFETMTAFEDAGMSVDDRMRVHVRDYLIVFGLSTASLDLSSEFCGIEA